MIIRLLEINVSKRSVEDFNEIKNNPFFDSFSWEDLYDKKIKPPVVPRKKNKKEEEAQGVPILNYMNKDIKNSALNKDSEWDKEF